MTLNCKKCNRPLTGIDPSGGLIHCGHCGWENSACGSFSWRSRGRNLLRVTPWGVSLVFHLALLATFMGVTMLVIRDRLPDQLVIPDAVWSDNPGGVVEPSTPQAEMELPVLNPMELPRPIPQADEITLADSQDRQEWLESKLASPSEGKLADLTSQEESGASSVPQSVFFGTGGNAHHIVYVVDCSGSMVDSFASVRQELLTSISRLRPFQDFHVVLFYGDGSILENTPGKLVPADLKQKEQVAVLLEGVSPRGSTGLQGGSRMISEAMPAIERAFEVLKKSDSRPGKLIYLLTDGALGQPTDVLREITRLSAGNTVQINTYLYWFSDPTAVALMEQIARQTRGRYKYISLDE